MQRMFPRPLLACIKEGRTPDPIELACMTEKVWREAFAARSGSRDREMATALAMTAMAGHAVA